MSVVIWSCVFLFIILGILCGCVTGLVPGLHVNTVALLFLGVYNEVGFDPMLLACFVMAMGVTHSFVDFVPSVFLGVPDSANVLALQPAHRMVIKGKGMDALVLSVAGGVFGIIALAVFAGPMILVVPYVYGLIKFFIPFMLVAAVFYMVAIERRKGWAFLVVMLSSLYGILMMRPRTVSADNALFLMLTGLFGLSTLFLSLFTASCFPKQRKGYSLRLGESMTGAFVGFLGGVFAGVMPGFGSSQSAIVMQKVFRVKGVRTFISVLGCINTIDIVVSVLSLYMIGRARSGSAIVISEVMEVGISEVVMFMGVALVAAGVAALVTIRFGLLFAEYMGRVNYRALILSVIMFLLAIVVCYEGLWGVFVCLVGTVIGMIPNLFGVKKSLLMCALIAPTVLYLFGIGSIFLSLLGL